MCSSGRLLTARELIESLANKKCRHFAIKYIRIYMYIYVCGCKLTHSRFCLDKHSYREHCNIGGLLSGYVMFCNGSEIVSLICDLEINK
jgi:hypothetical protein